MKRVCFLLKLKKDRIEDYLKAHQVWPQLLQAMSDVGIKNYSLFIRKDGLVVGYFEAEDPEESLRKVGQADIGKRWEENMSEYFESSSGDEQPSGVEEWLDQYFYME